MKVIFVETFEKWVRTAGLLCLLTLFALPAHAWWMCRYIVTSENAALFGYSSEEHDYVPVQFAKQGDTLYLLNEKGRLAVQKVNWDWVAYKWGKSYDPLYVNADEVQFAGFANPGNSPYLDDVELPSIPLQILPSIPRVSNKWPIIAAFIFSILFWIVYSKEKDGRVNLWWLFAIQSLLLICLFIYYFFTGSNILYHWFIDEVGGFVRSTLGQLAFALVAVTASLGSFLVIGEIAERYDLEVMFLIGYIAILLYFPVGFVMDLFTGFPYRYSNYFFFYALGLQVVILLIKIIKKPEAIGHYAISLAMFLLSVLPVLLVVVDFLFTWLLGFGWLGALRQIMEEGFW